jgi:hypothetical protein
MAYLYHQRKLLRNGKSQDLSPSKASPILPQLLRYLVPDRVYQGHVIPHPFGRLILASLQGCPRTATNPQCSHQSGYFVCQGVIGMPDTTWIAAPSRRLRGCDANRDLCLTIGVHPSAFGIHTDGDGRVLVPYNFKASVGGCTNVLSYLDTNETDTPKGVDEYAYRGLVSKTYRSQTDRIHYHERRGNEEIMITGRKDLNSTAEFIRSVASGCELRQLHFQPRVDALLLQPNPRQYLAIDSLLCPSASGNSLRIVSKRKHEGIVPARSHIRT